MTSAFGLHDAAFILVDLPVDVYIFYSSLTSTFRLHDAAFILVYLTLDVYIFYSSLTSTLGLHDAALILVYLPLAIYIFYSLLTSAFGLHDAAFILVYLPVDVYIFYSSLTSTFGLHDAAFILVYLTLDVYIFYSSTLGLHDAALILVYLPLDVYIFYSSYTCNTRTAQCSSYTCLLTIGCIYFPLVIYLQHSDCTMQPLYSFTYHWMYIFSTHHILATLGLHDAAVILVCLPLDVYIFYSSFTSTFGLHDAAVSECTYLVLVIYCYFGLLDVAVWITLMEKLHRLHLWTNG